MKIVFLLLILSLCACGKNGPTSSQPGAESSPKKGLEKRPQVLIGQFPNSRDPKVAEQLANYLRPFCTGQGPQKALDILHRELELLEDARIDISIAYAQFLSRMYDSKKLTFEQLGKDGEPNKTHLDYYNKNIYPLRKGTSRFGLPYVYGKIILDELQSQFHSYGLSRDESQQLEEQVGILIGGMGDPILQLNLVPYWFKADPLNKHFEEIPNFASIETKLIQQKAAQNNLHELLEGSVLMLIENRYSDFSFSEKLKKFIGELEALNPEINLKECLNE